MTRRLAGQVVLITGAARGIGEHTARLAAARGAHLALVGLEPSRLAGLAAELGARHTWHECDVTDQASLQRAVREAVTAHGGLDAVMANAGLANRGTVATGDIEALARTVEVNLIGVMRTVAATAEHVIARRGYYLLVSSAAAFTALPGMAAYCASKAGVENFGNALRLELAHHGVRVGTAHPGWIDTDLVRDAKEDLPSFRETLGRLPWPLRSTLPVQRCAEAFVDALERRPRRVYVPRPVAGVQALRTVINSTLSDAIVRRTARRMVPRMEREVAALGRAFGRHTAGVHLSAPRGSTPEPTPVALDEPPGVA